MPEKKAPSQRDALRGWSLAIANEYGSPNKLGAHKEAAVRWGRDVADWLWPCEECIAEQVELFGADDSDVAGSTSEYQAHS